MQRMTLREAAERTERSVTTLRRYIRLGRLRADKQHGRFGPEYFVTAEDLAEARLAPQPDPPAELPARRRPPGRPTAEGAGLTLAQAVPLTLFQELQLKHEQLLVQYGMVRAGGLRALELKAELESRQRQIEEQQREIARLRERSGEAAAGLRDELRRARIEVEGRDLEIAALHEKVRALEMLTRNAVTSESIEKQFNDVMRQAQRVEELSRQPEPPDPAWAAAEPVRDH